MSAKTKIEWTGTTWQFTYNPHALQTCDFCNGGAIGLRNGLCFECKELHCKLIKRFQKNVQIVGDCWEWTASLFSNGYGQFRVGKKKVKAHRFAFRVFNGRILPELFVCHSCDNPKCVRPSHLFAGSAKENAQDRDSKGRGKAIFPRLIGENNPAHKTDEQTVKLIRKKRQEQNTTFEQLASDFGLSLSQIANIIHRRSWKNV